MIYKRDPYLKRLPTVIDRTLGIQTYDVDNLYPQRADEVRRRSYTTKSAVERLAEFIDGEGFQDKILADLIMNADNMTGNDILDFIAQDKAAFSGFALHISYNLNYKISEITPIDFMFCRFGLPDEWGNVKEIRYSNNWERDMSKTVDRQFHVLSYPVFNPNPEVVRNQVEEWGMDNYPGQILLWTPRPGIYPECSFDPVFDNAQSQSEIGVFELSSIQNGFTATTIFKYPGKFESEQKKEEFKRKLNDHKGAAGAKSTIVVENPSGDELDLIETIQMQNTDKMFEFTSKNVKNAIRENMSMPAPILGQLPETGMFNQEDIENSYTYFNAVTRGHRNQIARVFKKIMSFWKDPLTIASFKIIPQAYDEADTPAQAPSEQQEFNADRAGMSGRQFQNLTRILRQIDQGKITREQGISMLKLSFGFSDEEANSLVNDIQDGDIDI